jgi:manganese oxidase
MVADSPGIWMFHCHIDDHMDAGMAGLNKVEP